MYDSNEYLPKDFPEPDLYSGVDKGWWDLITQLHKDLLELDKDYTVAQVKEKFGTLRYYFDTQSDDETRKEMNKLVNTAEIQSAKICEECGRPGKLRKMFWYKTLCQKHYLERTS